MKTSQTVIGFVKILKSWKQRDGAIPPTEW